MPTAKPRDGETKERCKSEKFGVAIDHRSLQTIRFASFQLSISGNKMSDPNTAKTCKQPSSNTDIMMSVFKQAATGIKVV